MAAPPRAWIESGALEFTPPSEDPDLDEDPRTTPRFLQILWPQDVPELLVFGFIVVITAAFVGGILHSIFLG